VRGKRSNHLRRPHRPPGCHPHGRVAGLSGSLRTRQFADDGLAMKVSTGLRIA
jgi:hypothetical protein